MNNSPMTGTSFHETPEQRRIERHRLRPQPEPERLSDYGPVDGAAVVLFAGAGGSSLGLHHAGFVPIGYEHWQRRR